VTSYLVYRASFYVLLTVATTILSGDATDSRVDWFSPALVAAVGALAFFTVDQNPRWGLPRELANVLALGTLGLLYLEYKIEDNELIRCLGHWITYLLMIKCFLPKTSRDDWTLFLLGLMQILIGSVINQGDTLGAWLFLWSMLAVWVLGQFFLQRESRRFEPVEVSAGISAQPPQRDPYRGLFDVPYVAATLRVLALTLLLGGFFFLLLPRQAGATRSRGSNAMAKHLTGFDEEVELGQLGEILENDSVVMSVAFADEDGKPVHPPAEPLWRGVALSQYEKRRWKRQSQRSMQMVVSMKAFTNNGPVKRDVIRQIIKLEPNDSAILFAMRPVLDMSAGSSRLTPFLNPVDGSIMRPETRGSYDYEILSDLDVDSPQDDETAPSPALMELLLGIPESLKARFRQMTVPIIQNVQAKVTDMTRAKARALESYLRESGEFGYTLDMKVVDSSLDPVEDFLVNRKEGHCEYFASALALLLRSIDIPSRVINGFKGGDWNELTLTMNVRQKHAHSWVEAYIGQDATDRPIWITLDPTPGTDRDQSVAQVGSVSGGLRTMTDMLRYVWVFYILGYDSSRQNRLLYTPIKLMVHEMRRGYSLIWAWAKKAFAQLFNFQSISSFISIKGFFVSFIVLLFVAIAGKLLIWVGKRLFLWWRGPTDESAGLTAGILFYRRLAQMLAEFDIRRTPAETQNEFALRASRFLSGHGEQTQVVADVPSRIVDAFYMVRFGERDLDPEKLQELEASLDALHTRLNTNNS
jgi:protein-glutamine gamma-glutamyltransferase